MAEEALRAVGDPREAAVIDHLRVGEDLAQRAVLVEERAEALRAAHDAIARGRSDHADARDPAAQPDQPDPVARVQEVDRREPARGVPHAAVERLVADPVDVGEALEAAPHRADQVMRLGHAQPELARERALAPGRVDHPARAHALGAGRALDRELVALAPLAERDLGHARADPHLDPLAAAHLDQVGLEPRAVELERGVERQVDRAELAHLGERDVALRAVEEIADAVLRQVILVEVLRELLAAHEVVGRDLDGRLADLERSAAAAALEHGDREIRQAHAQLAREQRARDAAADDRDVGLALAAARCVLHSMPPFTEITWPVT